MTTKVEWTKRPGTKGEAYNPIRAFNRKTGKRGWFCVHDSPGCEHCYAEAMNGWRGNGLAYRAQDLDDAEIFLDRDTLYKPLRWRDPRTCFVCSMTDLFAKFHERAWWDEILSVLIEANRHTFIVLTKRSREMTEYLLDPDLAGRIEKLIAGRIGPNAARYFTKLPPRHIWFGFSAEDQRRFDKRWADVERLATAGWITWCSAEPLLGPIDARRALATATVCPECGDGQGYEGELCRCGGVYVDIHGLRWLVAGYESGKFSRAGYPSWAPDLKDQCRDYGVAYFFKQWGSWSPRVIRAREFELIFPDGSRYDSRKPEQWTDPTLARMYWQGASEKAGGSLIDGKEYKAWPEI